MSKSVTHTTAVAFVAPFIARLRVPGWLPRRLANASLAGVLTLLVALFAGGRTQLAVGFVPEPWDKLLHATVFMGLAVLLAASHPRWGWRLPGQHTSHRTHSLWLLACLLLAATVGAADEIHQAFLPGRSADWPDWLADTAGACLGAALWYRLMRALAAGHVHTPADLT